MKPSAAQHKRAPRVARARRTLRLVAGLVALLGCLAGAAQLVPTALAAKPGGHSAAGGPAEKGNPAGGGKGKGGGLGSRVSNTACKVQDTINKLSLGFLGSSCSTDNGTTSPTQATRSVLKEIFAGGALVVGAGATELIHSLTKVPDYSKQSAGLNRLEREMTAIAFALLALTLTLSIMRFWFAGLSSLGGGAAGVEGVTRTLVAALLIVAWPFVFHSLVGLMNAITHVVLSTYGAAASVDRLHLAAALGAGAAAAFFFGTSKLGWFFGMVVLGFSTLVVVGLLLLKVALGDATIVIFVAAPLAFALWPLSETSWISGRVMGVLLAAVTTPVLWAVIFATAGVFEAGVLDAGLFALPLRLLTAVSMFFVALLAPFLLLRQAHGGVRHPAGVLARIGGVAAGRAVSQAAAEHIPSSLGGRKGLSGPQLQESRELGGGLVETKTYRGPAAEARKAELATTGNAAGLAAAAPEDPSVNGGLTGSPADSGSTDPYAPTDQLAVATGEGYGSVSAAAVGGDSLSGRRPEEPGSEFGFTNPGGLGIEDSAHVNRAIEAARDHAPNLAKASVAMGAFTPEAQQTIADTYHSQGSEGLRKTIAATAQFSDQITNGQAQALTVISGQSDENLATLFKPGEPPTLTSGPPAGQARSSPVRAQDERALAPAPMVWSSGRTPQTQPPPVPNGGQTPPPGDN